MNTEHVTAPSETSKLAYSAPVLVTFGDAKEMTRNINQVGSGDSLFSVLAGS